MTVLAATMTMFRNLRFALNSAWQSFWRNLAVSLAAVLSITLILILGGVNLLIGHAFSQVLDGFREKVSVISITSPTTRRCRPCMDFSRSWQAIHALRA